MLSCHLCLLILCYSLVFWVLTVPFVLLLVIYIFHFLLDLLKVKITMIY